MIKEELERRKCHYFNGGFCKNKIDCEFLHPDKICEMYLKDGKFNVKSCENRHPKDCKYWANSEKSCTHGKQC